MQNTTLALPEDLAGWERNVKEEDYARLPLLASLLLPVAEHLWQQHQVVVVDPHHAVAVLSFPDTQKKIKTTTTNKQKRT